MRLRQPACGDRRVLRGSPTLADIDGCDGVRRIHVAEALSDRSGTRG